MHLELKDLRKDYGLKGIFRNVNMQIHEGEMIAITGPSGCGKSTLLNIIGLIEAYDEGQLYLFGEKAPRPNSRAANQFIRKHISYLYQNYALVEYLTVEENLRMALKYVEKSNYAKIDMMKLTLESVGLYDCLKMKICELSGGEQQRVAIARAILKPCDIILADEPTGSLDDKNRDSILAILKWINKQGKTILVVTHDAEVARNCSRSIRMGPMDQKKFEE
ncbi:hypothetical protein A5886_001596 [Enterococcus sp. 8G7_MSG3316]|uniref:ABC transporter domain-containing protein n=1 Tax=Candidatus Enterococcus testudinis TaxID=1834191 RepID=A0A242A6H8_9ENTE|nr:ABC transporter ATP-binding protein [Enterococcus sp. 8G7_MSG3316]OTN76519.1 hypothetical protein A5886_001596 [Enterococcus sp. 8G7_MSG3316]